MLEVKGCVISSCSGMEMSMLCFIVIFFRLVGCNGGRFLTFPDLGFFHGSFGRICGAWWWHWIGDLATLLLGWMAMLGDDNRTSPICGCLQRRQPMDLSWNDSCRMKGERWFWRFWSLDYLAVGAKCGIDRLLRNCIVD
jgi:hypothetical protein